MRRFWICIASIAFAIAVRPSFAQEARLSVSTDSVFVGERFDLRVSIEHPAGSTVAFQDVPDGDAESGPLLSFGDVEVFSSRRLPPRLSGTVRIDSVVYEAATFAIDGAVLGPVAVDLIADGDTSVIRSSTIVLPVRSVLPADQAELQPPRPPISFPDPLWVWVSLGIGALVVVALEIWFWRRSRRKASFAKPRLAPYPEAVHRIQHLAIPDEEKAIKPFYVELSDLLRTYIARSLNTPALELTTTELTDTLSFDESVPKTALKNIRGTLRVADLVKFADMRPDSDAHMMALRKAQEAVETIEANLHPPEVENDDEARAEIRSEQAAPDDT